MQTRAAAAQSCGPAALSPAEQEAVDADRCALCKTTCTEVHIQPITQDSCQTEYKHAINVGMLEASPALWVQHHVNSELHFGVARC